MTNERAYTPSLVLHVLRNPHGWSIEAITAARLQAADDIERLKKRDGQLMEFLRSFISGGVNQDFKPWARELYQKLYSSHEPRAVDPNGPPHELRPLLENAVKALDMGVAISPGSYVHDELKLLLSQGASRDASSEPCEHLRSEFLVQKLSAQPPRFEMRKCLDCTKIFRKRLTVKSTVAPTCGICGKPGVTEFVRTCCAEGRARDLATGRTAERT